MNWDTALYEHQHDFVAHYGEDLFGLLPTDPPLSILDIGCGTGTLTARLAERADYICGIDASAAMVKAARVKYPHLTFDVQDAMDMPYESMFDVAFSNAVFHWIPDHARLLAAINAALKPGGCLIAEMGAQGNCDLILIAFQRAFEKRGYRFDSPFFYPRTDDYRTLLEKNGFSVETIVDFDRPTPLKGGESGLRRWIEQFYIGNLERMPKEEWDGLLTEIENALAPHLRRDDHWIADYRRLRFKAEKITPA